MCLCYSVWRELLSTSSGHKSRIHSFSFTLQVRETQVDNVATQNGRFPKCTHNSVPSDFHEDVLVWWEVSEYRHYQHYKAGVLAL